MGNCRSACPPPNSFRLGVPAGCPFYDGTCRGDRRQPNRADHNDRGLSSPAAPRSSPPSATQAQRRFDLVVSKPFLQLSVPAGKRMMHLALSPTDVAQRVRARIHQLRTERPQIRKVKRVITPAVNPHQEAHEATRWPRWPGSRRSLSR